MPQRAYYIDRLRVVMTVLVLVAHVWMTYGAMGSWFYREAWHTASAFSVLGTLYIATLQAFLMGFFFLLAGYFTPASYDHKGWKRYLFDRCIRLGIPLLLFGLVLAPVTVALSGLAGGVPFRRSVAAAWRSRDFINGPMWFAQALLLFSLGYGLWRVVAARTGSGAPVQRSVSTPSSKVWLYGALAVGATAYVVRIWAPVDMRYFGLWLGQFPSYLFLFGVGAAAWRYDWLSQLGWKQAQRWLVVSIVVWPVLPLVYEVLRLHNSRAELVGGTSVPAAVYAVWEPLVAWGLIAAAIVWFRTAFNRPPSRLQSWLSRRAYAVYVIHPPILVAISVLVRPWHGSMLAKLVLVSTAGCAACWLAADPLVRLPGLRRIF